MKNFIFVCSFFLSLQLFAKEEVTLGFVNLPPHINQSSKTGEILGVGKDYLEKFIFPKINRKFVFKNIPFNRGFLMLENNQLDAFLTVIHSKERAKKIQYSQKPFFEIRPGICFLKATFSKKTNLYQKNVFLKKKVGHISGTILPQALINSGATFDQLNGEDYLERGLKMLKLKRLDLLFHPEPLAMFTLAKTLKIDKDIECLDYSKDSQQIFIGWKQNVNKKLLEEFNLAYENSEISYNTFLQNYLEKL